MAISFQNKSHPWKLVASWFWTFDFLGNRSDVPVGARKVELFAERSTATKGILVSQNCAARIPSHRPLHPAPQDLEHHGAAGSVRFLHFAPIILSYSSQTWQVSLDTMIFQIVILKMAGGPPFGEM
ncbi:unnamed protein product [Effrenium voratum]|nr:unnamed protein product [Effrenium voratum]